MPNVPIAVTVDFNGVTLQNGCAAPRPAWTRYADNQQVQQGNNRIVWTSTGATSRGLHRWFHRRWHRVQDHELESWTDNHPRCRLVTIAANDNFNKKKDPVTLYYTVMCTSRSWHQAAPTGILYDPDIQNEGGGNRLVKAAG